MKTTANKFKSLLTGKAENLPPLILIHGDDGGVVRELVKKSSALVGSLDDPFMSDRISVEDLVHETGRLHESAATISFGAGLRLVRLEGVNGNISGINEMPKVLEAVKICLASPIKGSVIIISAVGVDAKSALVRAVEKDKTAMAVRCYHDSSRDIAGIINSFFRGKNQQVTPDALAFLLENLGSDRDITNLELEKLAIYAIDQPQITLDDCLACIASATSVSVFKLCDAIGMRNATLTDKLLNLLVEEGENLQSISTLVLRHLRRLQQAKGYVVVGVPPMQAIMKIAPPVIFGKQEFIAQMNKYPTVRLNQIAKRFYDLQYQSRANYAASNLIIERAILGLSL